MLATHLGRTTYDGPPGILEIGDEGVLDISGTRDVHLTTRYLVDVHGKARLRDQTSLLADFGTTFMLQKHYFGPGVGKLVILNDGDFLGGATPRRPAAADVREPWSHRQAWAGPDEHPGPLLRDRGKITGRRRRPPASPC